MKHQILTALRKMLGIHQMHWELADQINQTRLEILSEQRRNELWNHILNDTASRVTSTKYPDLSFNVVVLSAYRPSDSYFKSFQDLLLP